MEIIQTVCAVIGLGISIFTATKVVKISKTIKISGNNPTQHNNQKAKGSGNLQIQYGGDMAGGINSEREG